MKLTRSFLVTLSLAAVVFGLSACGGSGGGDASPGAQGGGKWDQMDWDAGKWS